MTITGTGTAPDVVRVNSLVSINNGDDTEDAAALCRLQADSIR
ncbi:hypothetical protein [Cryobacterium arcticum]|nr:hypothetical protein [Cryobacterium arcticum]